MSDATSRTPLLEAWYQQYLERQDSATFIMQVSATYLIGTLERLTQSESRMSRRAAVLALGLIGDYESNAVVGEAMRDEDRGVRTLAENCAAQPVAAHRQPATTRLAGRGNPRQLRPALCLGHRSRRRTARPGALVRRSLEPTRHRLLRLRLVPGIDRRLSSGARHQPLPLRRGGGRRPMLFATGPAATCLGKFPPAPCA